MAKYTTDEYENVISVAAKRALDNLEKDEPKDRSLQERISIFDEYRRKLRKTYPIDSFSKGYEFSISDYSADSLRHWLDGDKGYSAPHEYEGQSEASKILPMLQGVAKQGDDWYSWDKKELERNAKALGYNPRTPGATAEFLGVLSDYQTKHDRAELLKEGQQGANYWLNKLFYPSSTQEAENAVLSGEGGDPETLGKLRMLDAGTTLAMSLAPSLRLGWAGKYLGNPLVNSTIDAGLQGAAEGVRQIGTEKLSTTGQEADITPVMAALGAGATRPAITMSASGAATQLPGQIGQDIARGARRGARVGGSTERAGIKDAINLYNKDLAGKVLASKESGGVRELLDPSGRKYAKAVKVPEMAELFGISPEADGTYSAKAILKMYDQNPSLPKAVMAKDGKIEYGLFDNSVVPTLDEFPTKMQRVTAPFTAPKGERVQYVKDVTFGNPIFTLGEKDAAKYRALFQDKAADLDANRVAYNLGELFGQGASELGGRVEPVIKANPVNVADNDSEQRRYREQFRNQSWFKKLDADSKKIIEEAFKKKEDEQQ